jgi:DNA-binding MarR family transcriptional regulator/ribosomal protein S18 acetylase RimI-like enzyme
MEADQISQVRAFNRTVTQRIGALDSEYLARGRPLGASRVLWEIGPGGTDVRSLRARLGLDSGYLSRILRSLERDGLIVTAADEADRRVRRAHPTSAGRAEQLELDRASDQLAETVLAPLDGIQQDRLVQAMATVERLLTAGLVGVDVEEPTSAAARHCIGAYLAELDSRFETGFDPARSISAEASELRLPAGLLLVARLRGEPVGCGALKLNGAEPAEIKRMWVAPAARGLGLGRRLLADLERHAEHHGAGVVHLETNGALSEAISLYRSAGYTEVGAFNDEPYAHHWFEKRLRPA